MAFDPTLPETITEALRSHAMSLGVFESINGHEPMNAPGETGLTAAVWLQSIDTPPRGSGLAKTSAIFTYSIRAYSRLVMQPVDAIDPNLTRAMGLLVGAISGDFTLGGTVMAVDLLGMGGKTMRTEAGYIVQDDSTLRVFTLNVPVIVVDVWDQAP